MEDNIHRIWDIGYFAFKNNFNIIYNTVRRDEGIEIFIKNVKSRIQTIKEDFIKVENLFNNSPLKCFYPSQISGITLHTKGSKKTFGERIKCPALDNELCILYNGDVTPCNMFNPYVLGNLSKDRINEILIGEKRKKFIEIQKTYYYLDSRTK